MPTDWSGMWKRTLATAASTSVLVAGLALPGADADAVDGEPAGVTASLDEERAPAADDAPPLLTTAEILRAQQAAAQRAAGEAAARAAAERAAAEQAAAQLAAERAAAEQAAAQVAAAQVAAERAAEQAAARAAAETAAQAKTAQAPKKVPKTTSTPVAWTTTVVDSGGQAAVDKCLGGLTRWFEDVDGKPYYPIHRGCGGTPILSLHLGNRVRIGSAIWIVTDARDVPRGSPYSAAAGLKGQILLQTCYRDNSKMRLVALTAA